MKPDSSSTDIGGLLGFSNDSEFYALSLDLALPLSTAATKIKMSVKKVWALIQNLNIYVAMDFNFLLPIMTLFICFYILLAFLAFKRNNTSWIVEKILFISQIRGISLFWLPYWFCFSPLYYKLKFQPWEINHKSQLHIKW